ncbi:MAG: VCBS repeat-containing protein [Nitrospirae bacterium]|nr:VCBS repeat-containing protein [Nitrospirota bacterium]
MQVCGLITALSLFVCLGCGGSKVSQPASGSADSFVPLKDKPFSVAYADFNSDGRLDAAVAVKYAGIYVYFNREGHLDLSAPLIIRDLIEMPTAVAVGDFNGDGIQDIAATSEKFVGVAVNDGSGHFTNSGLHLNAPRYGFNMALADVNHDGITDIAVVGAMDREVYVYTSRGPLNFELKKVDLTGNAQQADLFAKTLSVGDIDNDGYADLIIPETFEPNVWLLRNKGASFSPAVILTTSMEQKVAYAVPLYYDVPTKTSYIAAVSGTADPKLEVITIGTSGAAAVAQRYRLPAGSPVHIDKISSTGTNNAGRLIITHDTALSFVSFDRDAITVSDQIIPLNSKCGGYGIMSAYNKDIHASLVVCRNTDGVAVVHLND